VEQDDGSVAEVFIVYHSLDDTATSVVLPVLGINVRNNFKTSDRKGLVVFLFYLFLYLS
jgi:hypothetical protein